MRIFFSSSHKYPGSLHGVAAHSVHDYLVKGLAELGHDVFYHLKEKPDGKLPEGVVYTNKMKDDIDVYHINSGQEDSRPKEDLPGYELYILILDINPFLFIMLTPIGYLFLKH